MKYIMPPDVHRQDPVNIMRVEDASAEFMVKQRGYRYANGWEIAFAEDVQRQIRAERSERSAGS